MKERMKKICSLCMAAAVLTASLLTGCGQDKALEEQPAAQKDEFSEAQDTAGQEDSSGQTEIRQEDGGEQDSSETGKTQGEEAPSIEGLTYESSMELIYAEGFDIYYYSGGYELIDVHDSARYLLIPEGGEAPQGLDEDVVVLQKPLDNIYLAATSAMALFDALDSLGAVKMTGTQASGWYVENAVAAMEAGDMVFAGKYSEPDYEMLVDEGCDLALESTMILHTPKVQEMIEMLGIPVFIDRSSYEEHPLGRTEWIKLYGAMMDKEEQAQEFFAEQAQVIDELKDFENTGKTVAFFYISTDGSVAVRRSSDYIPRMIEIAGGKYIFDNLENVEGNSATVSMTMEEFYATAVDADYLIYNATIDNPIQTTEELLAKSELFADFKAVKEGNVWCAGKYLYQATDIVGEMITDVNLMLTGGEESQMTFLTKVS